MLAPVSLQRTNIITISPFFVPEQHKQKSFTGVDVDYKNIQLTKFL